MLGGRKMKRRGVKKKSRVRNRDCAWHVITTTWSHSARIVYSKQIELVYSSVTLDASAVTFTKPNQEAWQRLS